MEKKEELKEEVKEVREENDKYYKDDDRRDRKERRDRRDDRSRDRSRRDRRDRSRSRDRRSRSREEARAVRPVEEVVKVNVKQEKVKDVAPPPAISAVKASKNANYEPLGVRKQGRSKWDQGPNEVTLDPAIAKAVPPPPTGNEYRPESPSRDEEQTKSVRARMMEKKEELKEEVKE